jgi:hypothetical protein
LAPLKGVLEHACSADDHAYAMYWCDPAVVRQDAKYCNEPLTEKISASSRWISLMLSQVFTDAY